MEVLFLILLIVFISKVGKKNKKPDGAARPAPGTGRARPVRESAKGAGPEGDLARLRERAAGLARARQAAQPKRAVELSHQERELRLQALKAQRAARLSEAAAAPIADLQGHSVADAEGCVGGSMEHPHTEGESRAEHSRHVEAARRREAEELLAQAQAASAAAVNARRLREAVVMAEVLGKPKALRKGV